MFGYTHKISGLCTVRSDIIVGRKIIFLVPVNICAKVID